MDGLQVKNGEVTIDLEKLLRGPNAFQHQDVAVKYDHYFKRKKNYRGYFIGEILNAVIKQNSFDTTNALVIFECRDGYMPVMDLSKMLGPVKGYIAYKDLSPGVATDWPDSVQAKFKPYYVVWDNVAKGDNSFMWPYGLTSIRLASAAFVYKGIYPTGDSSLVTGFQLFRNTCMKCHSINKVGGTMAPELNFPRNITEYWREEDIISFVKNPSSFRYNSHMPSITEVSDNDLQKIVRYLIYMKSHKPTAE